MSEDSSMAQLALPGRLDSGAASSLLESLIALRGGPLLIIAAEVGYATTPCLQILLAAAEAWKADGNRFRIADASSQFVEAVGLLGLTQAQLPLEPMTP